MELNNNDNDINYNDNNIMTYKVVLLGNSGVGKTSILNKYIKNTFTDNSISTAGANYFSKTFDFSGYKKVIKLEIWDTAGQERYKSITKMYYKNSDAIIFVFDITNSSSFNGIDSIYKEVCENLDTTQLLLYLIGNKSDLYEFEQVSKKEANDYALSINASYSLVSAKNGTGLESLFENIAKTLYGNSGGETYYDKDNENSFKICENKKTKEDGATWKKWCCINL